MRNRILIAFSLLFCLNSSAFAERDIRGSSDPQLLPRFPQAWIVKFNAAKVPEYRLASGPMKKLEGVIAPESIILSRGFLTRVTYRVPDSHKPEEVFNFYLKKLQALDATILFQCRSRQCGSSNQWANNYFKVSELYGVDRSQSFLSAKLHDQQVALYAVKRGNRRVYVHLDILSLAEAEVDKKPSESALKVSLEILKQQGFSWWNENESTESLVQFMQNEADFRLMIVGYRQLPDQSLEGLNDEEYSELVHLSSLKAQALADRLVERIRVVGVGPAVAVANLPAQEGVWLQRH